MPNGAEQALRKVPRKEDLSRTKRVLLATVGGTAAVGLAVSAAEAPQLVESPSMAARDFGHTLGLLGDFSQVPETTDTSVVDSLVPVTIWGKNLPDLGDMGTATVANVKPASLVTYGSGGGKPTAEELNRMGVLPASTESGDVTAYDLSLLKPGPFGFVEGGILIPDKTTVFARTKGNAPTRVQVTDIPGPFSVLGVGSSTNTIYLEKTRRALPSVDGTKSPDISNRGQRGRVEGQPIHVTPQVVVLSNAFRK